MKRLRLPSHGCLYIDDDPAGKPQVTISHLSAKISSSIEANEHVCVRLSQVVVVIRREGVAVSGLIINFSTESGPPPATLEALLGHPFVQVGEGSGHRLPIVVETSDAEQTDSMWEWLHSLPGVTLIDLAFLHFDEDEDAHKTGACKRGQAY